VAYEPDLELLADLELTGTLPQGIQWKTTTGCEQCNQSGFKGRVAIHELLEITEALRELIHRREPDHEIRQMARQHGMQTLLEDGIAKAAMGPTTLEEVLRVAPPMESNILPPRPASAHGSAPAAASAPMRTPSLSVSVEGDQQTPALPHILVLEDNTDTQALLQLLLEKNGYTVTIAGDGICS
jgi:CheY-like chemotaxis protein